MVKHQPIKCISILLLYLSNIQFISVLPAHVVCGVSCFYHLPLQENRGIIVVRIDGIIYDGVFSSKGEEWKKRRRVLTPAFSANKMKMVRLRWFTYQN